MVLRRAALAAGLVASVSAAPEEDKGPNPIQRVIGLLKQMKEEVAAEEQKDAKLYKELTCWCKTNRKEKDAAIKSNDAKVETMKAEITKYAGN